MLLLPRPRQDTSAFEASSPCALHTSNAKDARRVLGTQGCPSTPVGFHGTLVLSFVLSQHPRLHLIPKLHTSWLLPFTSSFRLRLIEIPCLVPSSLVSRLGLFFTYCGCDLAFLPKVFYEAIGLAIAIELPH